MFVGWWCGRRGSAVRTTTFEEGTRLRTLHIALRVSELDRSLAFYAALGYEVVGEVAETPIGHLTMLKLPGDEFVTVELVHDGGPVEHGTDVSHLVVQVESMAGTLRALAGHGIEPVGPVHDGGGDAPTTTLVADPDGRRIELVQWPPGHADGMTAADWAEGGK